MKLTAHTVASLTCPAGKTVHLVFDERLPGFGVALQESGHKSYILQYSIPGQRKRHRHTFGSTTALTPAQAFEAAKDMKAKVRLGGEPAADKARARIRATQTFRAQLPRYLAFQAAQAREVTCKETKRHLERYLPSLHPLPLAEIERSMIAARLAEIASNNGPVMSNRVRSSLSGFLTWAVGEGFVTVNEAGFTNKQVEKSRERVLSLEELSAIWKAVGSSSHDAIVKLLTLTGCRREEIGDLLWSEIDLNAGTILLPESRTKNHKKLLVPLSAPARAILVAQPRRTEANGSLRDFVFGTVPEQGFQGWSTGKRQLDKRLAIAKWTVHDLRRSLSTWAHEALYKPHVIEMLLGHVEHKRGVKGVYNHAEYLDERRRILNRWAAYVTGEIEDSTVVALRSA